MTGPRIPRVALLVLALLVPTLSLVPFGSLWLWQNGYLLIWSLATAVVVAIVYYLERRLVRRVAPGSAFAADSGAPRAEWTPLQTLAWDDVSRLAGTVTAERLSSRDAVLALALETLDVVARRLHPERRDPTLQFTLPDALAVIHRASGTLREVVISSVPLGERITVAHLMQLYRWRGALRLVESGMDLWRIVRLFNPINAATQELRERYSRQLFDAGREHLARRLGTALVQEVGRAAIDLYGGGAAFGKDDLASHMTEVSQSSAAEPEDREPLRILVAGQVGAGKSSLVNALTNSIDAAVDVLPTTTDFTTYQLSRAGLPSAVIIDSPGLGSVDSGLLAGMTDSADVVLWVSSATQAARSADAAALKALRARFADRLHRSPPPLVLVLTHIDRLRPFGEWRPPYDVVAAEAEKARAVKAAMAASGVELGFALKDVVPVRADGENAYNLEAVWTKLLEVMPEAKRARLLRILEDIKAKRGWKGILGQTGNALRLVGRALRPGRRG